MSNQLSLHLRCAPVVAHAKSAQSHKPMTHKQTSSPLLLACHLATIVGLHPTVDIVWSLCPLPGVCRVKGQRAVHQLQ